MMRVFGPVWTAPIMLGVLTVVGLASALVGDGIWDALSALTLGTVVAVGGYFSLRRAKVSQKRPVRSGVSES